MQGAPRYKVGGPGDFTLAQCGERLLKLAPVPWQQIPPLHGCPVCSAPPAVVTRPWIARGQRSGYYMILGCVHVLVVFPGREWVSDSASGLAQRWNERAQARAELLYPVDHPRRTLILPALRP